MTRNTIDKKFNEVANIFPIKIRSSLLALSDDIKHQVREIRIRIGLPIQLSLGNRQAFLDGSGLLTYHPEKASLKMEKETLEECFRMVCGYSVHAHQEDLKKGFVTLSGGHRVGICGTCVYDRGEISGLRDISSLNIRIAREITGAATSLIQILQGNVPGMLIAGVPGCGKTTVLRDLARQLSNGMSDKLYKVTVIDERGEIAAVNGGVIQNDLGYCCDVLSNYPKDVAILQAIRTLSPEYILCDEIGDSRDVEGIKASVYAGVKIIATVHAGSMEDLRCRSSILPLINTGAFQILCFLKDGLHPGIVDSVYKAGYDDVENYGNHLHYYNWNLYWPQSISCTEKQSEAVRKHHFIFTNDDYTNPLYNADYGYNV